MAPELRFDRGARYGAAVVGMAAATYLAAVTDFSGIVQSETYAGTIRNDAPVVNIVQFVVIVGGMATSLLLLPTSWTRRVWGVTVVVMSMCLWATLGLERGAGLIREPVDFWAFVLNQGFVTLIAAVGGWLVARGRHPLTFVLVIVAIVPPLVAPVLVADNFSTGGYALVIQGLVILLGLGAVWAAVGVDRLLDRRADAATPAAAPTG